jgi:hypothetical protein
MPQKLVWTPTQDALVKRMRAEGATWDAIAAELSVSRFTIIERGRRIGACRPPPPVKPPLEDRGRPPLPPGHPYCWLLLTEGTVLEGTDYPYPVFISRRHSPPRHGGL